MFTLGFAAAAVYWPGWINGGTTPRWAALAIGIPLLFILARPGPGRTGGLPSVRFWLIGLACAALSLLWTTEPLGGVDDLIHLLILAGAFWLGATADPRQVWAGLATGITISVGFAVFQSFGWEGLPQAPNAGPAGLFINRNLLGEAGAVALVAMLVDRRWLLAIGPFLAVTLTHSKSVAAALLLVACFWLAPRRPALAVCGAVLLAAAFALALTSQSLAVRMDFWAAALPGMNWHGNGLGSFAKAFPFAEYAHSEPVQAAYELGLLAIPFLLGLMVLYAGATNERDSLVLAAILAIGLFSFPLHMPVTGFAAALAAGSMARSGRGLFLLRLHRGTKSLGGDLRLATASGAYSDADQYGGPDLPAGAQDPLPSRRTDAGPPWDYYR